MSKRGVKRVLFSDDKILKPVTLDGKGKKRKVKSVLPIDVPTSELTPTVETNCGLNPIVPDNMYHLGDNKYIVTSDFQNCVRVHLRQFLVDKHGKLQPTKMGLTLDPLVWKSFVTDMDMNEFPSNTGKIGIVQNCLMISSVLVNDQPQVVLQKFFQRKDFSRCFYPQAFLLNETEWCALKMHVKDITPNLILLKFGKSFQQGILEEIRHRNPFVDTSELDDCADAEIVLTTSLIELLKDSIDKEIQGLFQCHGCFENYGNQLGHECITYNNANKLEQYGERALLVMDIKELTFMFVEKNIHMCNYITDTFLKNIDVNVLIKNAKDLYVASDVDPFRMF